MEMMHLKLEQHSQSWWSNSDFAMQIFTVLEFLYVVQDNIDTVPVILQSVYVNWYVCTFSGISQVLSRVSPECFTGGSTKRFH